VFVPYRHLRLRRRKESASKLPGCFGIPYASFYTYSPKGQSSVSNRSRVICSRVKSGDDHWLRSYVASAQREIAHNARFDGLFNADTVLVPIPECQPGKPQRKWTAHRLATHLRKQGLGGAVWPGLRRARSVERSSTAWVWARPTVQQHYQSFAVIPLTPPPNSIVLVDDVITKGRTLIAAAMRMREAFPDARIGAFVLVRTRGLIPEIQKLLDPCCGEIRWNGEDVDRDP